MALLVAKTETGWVEGLPAANQAVSIFRGIPFAAPPVGELRWRAPKPAEPWEGVRQCYKFANIGMQSGRVSEGGGIIGSEFYVGNYQRSEDCLYLNVWTPAKTPEDKLPVVVYIHGGGYNSGYSYLNAYDGEAYAKRNVIFVTIAYRLAVFGFLAHPELSAESGEGSGAYGLRDQLAAIQWVKRNIAAFGGDPECITLSGQSGGAAGTEYMCASPLSKGLFQRAIMQSGGGFRPVFSYWGTSPERSQELGQRFFQYMGYSSLAEARAASAEELQNGYEAFAAIPLVDESMEKIGIGGKVYPRFTPNVDGFVLPQSPLQQFIEGKHPEIDYLLGSTQGEGERTMVANLAWAENELQLGRKPSYLYHFTYVPPGAESAHHSVEHHYVFQTLVRSQRPYNGFDFELSNELAERWANFAKCGNPNGEGFAEWSPYTEEKREMLMIAEQRHMEALALTDEQKRKVEQLRRNEIPYALQ